MAGLMLNLIKELLTAVAEKAVPVLRLVMRKPLSPEICAREVGKETGALREEAVAELNCSTPAV